MKCGDCAFIPGTEASNSPNTLVRAHLSTITGQVFECHLHDGPCAGWAEAVRLRKRSPLKPTATMIDVADKSIELMSHMERLALVDQEPTGGSNG